MTGPLELSRSNVTSKVVNTSSSVSVCKLSDSVVEIRHYGHTVAVLHGERGQAIWDIYNEQPRSNRGLYAQGVLHGRAIALQAAEIEAAWLRDPNDPEAGGLNLCVRVGGTDLIAKLTPRRVSVWLLHMAQAMVRQIGGLAADGEG